MFAIRREQANARMWELRAASYPHLAKESDRSAVVASLRELQLAGFERLHVFDTADDETRVRLIGCQIDAHGERYTKRHPDQLAWLAGMGLTTDQAVAIYAAWKAAQTSDPFSPEVEPHGDDSDHRDG